MSVSMPDSRAMPRHVVESLRRFIQLADAPPAANGVSLSEAGFTLLTLKDQILSDSPRAVHFCQDFINRPLNGIEVLGKVVIVLQGIVNSTHVPSSKISSLLSRNNSNTNRKRKAAVAEADCIECIKILLEKSDAAWRYFLESTTGLDAILYSVHSPQLDSKCYALEILLLLLEQQQGFIILLRALTALSARNRDYLRLSVFVAQLKHGLHTNKLHIQILVVRLFNKMITSAPSQSHVSLIRAEAALAQFSADYVEKLVSMPQTQLGGLDVLMDELAIWKSLSTSALGSHVEHNHIYGLSETESDTMHSDRSRRHRGGLKYPSGNTTVVKNVERQRFKKQGMGSGGRSTAPSYYPDSTTGRHTTAAFYPDRRSLTLSNRMPNGATDMVADNTYSPPSSRVGYAADSRTMPGGMRRARSEGAMIINEREFDNMRGETSVVEVQPRGLKRVDEQPLYHPIQQSKALSRSVHDLSLRVPDDSSTLVRPASARPSSAAQVRMLRTASPRHHTPPLRTELTDSRMSSSPQLHNRYVSPASPRARFADPPTVEAQQPHAGFSYLFPTKPVVASVLPKRVVTPESYAKQAVVGRPPSAPAYAKTHSPRFMSPSPLPPDYDTQPYTENGQVVYIPINVDNNGSSSKIRSERRDSDYTVESRSSSRNKLRSPSINGTIGEDVRDALSQFDYLNEYDNSSLRGQREATTYHF